MGPRAGVTRIPSRFVPSWLVRSWLVPAVWLLTFSLLAACSGSTTAGGTGTGPDDHSDGPGVTGDTVKIGFVLLDSTRLASALKLDLPDQGDQQAQIDVMVDWVNENGGIAGRQVEAVTRDFDALLDSAEAEETLCNEFTQDDEVFAVVLWGMFQENLRPCFAQRDTMMVEGTLYPLPEATMGELAPFYLAPNFPTYDQVIAGLDGVFAETGYLDGGTVGVLGVDTAANRRIYEDQLAPVLEAAGSEAVEVRWIDLTDSANTRAGYEQAVIAYKAAGVDRLVTLGGSRLLSFFLDYATKQHFLPQLALSSYDNIDFNVVSYPEAMGEAVGLSIAPSWDFTEELIPSPMNDEEAECRDVLAAGGIDVGGRQEARTAMYNCDALRLLRDAAESAGIGAGDPLNAVALHGAVVGLGDEWAAAENYATALSKVASGGAGYQVFTMDTSGAGTTLVGDPAEFG